MNNTVHARFACLHIMIMLIAVLLCGLSTIQAQTTQFTYQGRLTDGGSPANGSYDLQIKLYDALTGGNQIGVTNPFNGIAVTGGVFTVTLDFGAAAFPGANRWAEISARPAGNGTFTTLTPRQPVTSTPYAIRSLGAASADTLSSNCAGCVTDTHVTAIAGSKVTGKIPAAAIPAGSNDYIQNTTTQQAGSNFNISGNGIIGGSVGIGTATISPATRFQLNGSKMGILSPDGGYGQLQIGNPTNGPTDEATVTFNMGLTAFGNPPAVTHSWGIGAGAFGLGGAKLVLGYGTQGTNFGPKLTIQNDGNVGIGTASPDFTLHAARDVTYPNDVTPNGAQLSLSGRTSPSKRLNIGYDTSAATAKGFGFIAAGNLGDAWTNLALQPSGGDVGIGTTAPAENLEVSSSAAGDTGILATTYSTTTARGIFAGRRARGTAAAPTAVQADDSLAFFSGRGYGATGFSVSRSAMEINATENWSDSAQGSNIIFGTTPNGSTTRFLRMTIDQNGDVNVNGRLSKGAGSFKIDHPLDPENKYLYHSFVESPDMMNIYNGNVTTDASGEAEIALPEWFETLNRDFRYQLTVIGQFAQAIVAEKIKNNRFKIRTSLPGVEVSWQVTGVRQDPFANANRIKIEEDKPLEERGKYLHAEAYGQPTEKSLSVRKSEQSEERKQQ